MLSPRRSAQLGLLAACTLILASIALLGWSASISPCPEGVGQAPPAFMLQDTEGNPQSFPPSDGKIEVLYFWSMRQTTCLKANKAMAELYDRLDHNKVRFIGVHVPTADSADAVAVQAVFAGMEFPILMDHNGEVSRLYHAIELPFVCVVGPAGLVRSIGSICPLGQNASKTTPHQIETLIQQLMLESTGDSNTTQTLAKASGQPK